MSPPATGRFSPLNWYFPGHEGAGAGAESEVEGSAGYDYDDAPPSIFCAFRGRLISAEEQFCDTLRSYRASLKSEGNGPTDTVEKAKERQRKIRAIEECLIAFASYFRTD
jgi:hypothetical protein